MLKQNTRKDLYFLLRRLRRDERGVAAFMMAILFAVFLAFGGLVLDGGRIYFEKRRMQAAADAAAYGAALELRRGIRPNLNLETEVITAGRDDADLNGFEHGVNTIDVAINHPPTTGLRAGSANHVEAIISQTVPTYLMRILSIDSATIRARGVAGLESNGDACVIALDRDDKGALRVAGTALLDAQCGIMSNSSDPCAMEVNGAAEIHGTWIGVYGGDCGGGLYDPPAQNGALPIIDPLASMTPPDYASVTPVFNNVKVNNATATLDPGYYSGGIEISGSSSVVTFNEGLYVLDSGLKITGGVVTGSGVTFY